MLDTAQHGVFSVDAQDHVASRWLYLKKLLRTYSAQNILIEWNIWAFWRLTSSVYMYYSVPLVFLSKLVYFLVNVKLQSWNLVQFSCVCDFAFNITRGWYCNLLVMFSCCLTGPALKFDGQKTSFMIRLVSTLAVYFCCVGSSHTKNCCRELRFSFAQCQAEGV